MLTATSADIPRPICDVGYPQSQLETMLPVVRLKQFYVWMRGQTFSECNGLLFNGKNLVPSGCGPHGYVYYESDVRAFLAGRPVLD